MYSKIMQLLFVYFVRNVTVPFFLFTYRAATVHIPKPPPEKTAKAIQKRRELRKMREAEVILTYLQM